MQVRCVKTLAVKIRRVFNTRIFGKYNLSVPMESVASLVKVLFIDFLCKAISRHFRER